MSGFLERHSQNALIGSMIASAIALISSVISMCVTVHYTNTAQVRQMRLEQISKFDSSGEKVVEAGGSFIAAVNDHKQLDPAKTNLSAVLATQIQETDNISKFFDGNVRKSAEQYEEALMELNQVAQKTSAITEMRPWAESFGRALDAKLRLSQELYTALGVGANQPGPSS
jgi:hypothetical protein